MVSNAGSTMTRLRPLALACAVAFGAFSISAYANQKVNVSQHAYGGVGLVTMPSARMHEGGDFGVHISRIQPYNQFVFFGQPAPWLEVLFKYTDVDNRIYGISNQGYKDKSFDLKLRLIEERYYVPEVAVGFRDLGGTGLFSGEYLVASKQLGQFDISLGLGWGYLGQQGQLSNPFAQLDSGYRTRQRDAGGEGGELNISSYFTGERTSIFGGIAYQLKNQPLVLKLDYDANDYQNEPLRNRFKQPSPINIAGVYSWAPGIDLHLGLARGDTLMMGVTLRTSLTQAIPPKLLDAPFEPLQIRPDGALDDLDWQNTASEISHQAGFQVQSVYFDESRGELHLTGAQTDFHDLAKGAGRVTRVLHNRLSDDAFKSIVLEERVHDMTLTVAEVDRAAFVEQASLVLDATDVSSMNVNGGRPASEGKEVLYVAKPSPLTFSLMPSFSANIGGPDEFVLYQLGLRAGARYHFDQQQRHFINMSFELGLIDNYELFEFEAPSNLPRVRTQIRDYLKTSQLRMSQLYGATFSQPQQNLFWLGYAGYLESMYAGVGTEMLYRPFGENWALGLDINYVQQRAFAQDFGLRDYTAVTGHLTAYYEFEELLLQLSAGQYLAKDRGATLDISRRFFNNARLGAWATRTNVSAADFGEGSFDKGVYVVIPFDMFSLRSTRESGRANFSFLTRDGGQKLIRPQQLFEITDKRRSRLYQRHESLID